LGRIHGAEPSDREIARYRDALSGIGEVQRQAGLVDRQRVRIVRLQLWVESSTVCSQDTLDANGSAPRYVGQLCTCGRRQARAGVVGSQLIRGIRH
jgi:hypothetical protein